MIEVLYRIYKVATEEEAKENLEKACELGFYSSTSKDRNFEVLMDCLICDSREQFKEIIRDTYGENIPFSYSKKLEPGRLYCIIIGEHCYNSEQYFTKVEYKCDYCGCNVSTVANKHIYIHDWELRNDLFNIDEYRKKHFCSNKCKQNFIAEEKRNLSPGDDTEFFISKDMFTEKINGYIYKITKQSTGEFYIGQTRYAPVFRWGQHLKTTRFDIKNILDYTFETIHIVNLNENILDVEKSFIEEYSKKYPTLCLNVVHNLGLNNNENNLLNE